MIFLFAESFPTTTFDTVNFVLRRTAFILGPFLGTRMLKNVEVLFEPPWVAGIKDIEKVTNFVGVIESENTDFATFVVWTNEFHLLFCKRRPGGEQDASFAKIDIGNNFIWRHPNCLLFLSLLSAVCASLRRFP